MHEEPQVPNYGKPGQGVLLKRGLCLAIEPMVTQGAHEVKTLKDGWTVVTVDGKLRRISKHTVALTDEGPRILTLRENDYLEHDDVVLYRPKEEVAA